MSLDRLIKAKKSVSGIFSRVSGAPIQPCSPKRNGDDVPSCETPGPYPPGASSTVPDASEESSTKDTSSARKGLMGSLRKQKLRSVSSLRSLQSPTKTKQSDTPASPLAKSPYTPKHRLNSSLVLDFEESPPDKPIFDLNREDSITSSLKIHRSSPVPVPTSEKQSLQSLIPFGTVPLSPAPIQRILELNQTEIPPSPKSILAYNSESETMRRSASTKSALSDSLQGAAVYFDEPIISYKDLERNDLLPDECFTQPGHTEDLGQKLVCEEPSWVHGMESSSDHSINDEQDSARGSATNKAPDAANVNKTAEEHEKAILGESYPTRAYRRAVGKCRLDIKLLASDSEDGDDDAKDAQSLLHSPTQVRKHDSTWGQHAGLYDGSGYGAGSSLRPVTGVTETADVTRTRIPGAFSDHENEAPTIISRLWNNTYPRGLDTDFPGQGTVGDAATPEAQEQSKSRFKDYEAFQGMLDPRGNA